MATSIPSHHRALVLSSITPDLSGLSLKRIPTTQVTTGSAILKVLTTGLCSYSRDIYTGTRPYPLPTPLTPGFSAIGRIAAVGDDAISLKPGQLVYVDCVMRGRDDVDAMILSGISDGFSEGSNRLMRDVWRDSTWAEYVRVPLENCVVIDEGWLCGELGYKIEEVLYVSYLLVPFGGFRDIGLEPGETIVIVPATGGFGGAGVEVAVAMGCRVIAMGRNEGELKRLKEFVLAGKKDAMIETVKISGDEEKDAEALKAFGTIDAVLDLSPPAATGGRHLNAAITALRRKGRVSLMGFWTSSPPSFQMIAKDIRIQAKFMYERDDIFHFFKMLERGLFPRGKNFVDARKFSLEDWRAALDAAAEHTGIGKFVVMNP